MMQMIVSKKQNMKLAVMGMCIALLLSWLSGCKRQLMDGPDMERVLWREFTISQTSDVYEDNFAYTVTYDEDMGEITLATDVYDFEKGYPVEKSISLKDKTASALFNLNLMSLPDTVPSQPDAEICDGTCIRFTVVDLKGNISEKDLPNDIESEILVLLKPYIEKIEYE